MHLGAFFCILWIVKLGWMKQCSGEATAQTAQRYFITCSIALVKVQFTPQMKCSGLCFLKKNKGQKRPVIFFTNIVYTCNFYFIFSCIQQIVGFMCLI